MATISTHNGSGVSRGHNLRKEKIVSKEDHIDPEGIHETWIDEAPRNAYERLFGESVRAYNEKQIRSDRRIDDYYNQVRSDQKKHNTYEMIIGIYPTEEETVSQKTGKDILKEFVSGWNKRNPNLEIIGAYYHADELGKAPHVHIDYIPVAHGYKNGPETQTALVRALGEQGFSKQAKITAQIQWEKRENEHLEKLCAKRGITIDHPQEGRGVKHLHTQTFKAQRDLENVESTIKEKEQELKALATEVANETQKNVEMAKIFFGDPEKIKEEAAILKGEVSSLTSEKDQLTCRIQALNADRETAIKETSQAASEMMDAQDKLKSTKIEIDKAESTLKALQGHILTAEEAKSFSVKTSFFGSKAVIEGTPEELQSLVATAQKVENADKRLSEAKKLESQAQDIINNQGRILQSAIDDGEQIKSKAKLEAQSIAFKAAGEAENLMKKAKEANYALEAENSALRQENANIKRSIANIKQRTLEGAQKEADKIINQAYKDIGAERLNARLQQMIGLVPQIEVMNARDEMMETFRKYEKYLTPEEKEMFREGNVRGIWESMANRFGRTDTRVLEIRQRTEAYQKLKDSPHTVEDVMKMLEQKRSRGIGR